jgi:hypothetical protein
MGYLGDEEGYERSVDRWCEKLDVGYVIYNRSKSYIELIPITVVSLLRDCVFDFGVMIYVCILYQLLTWILIRA